MKSFKETFMIGFNATLGGMSAVMLIQIIKKIFAYIAS